LELSWQRKLMILFAATVVLAVAGDYLAGYLLRIMLGLEDKVALTARMFPRYVAGMHLPAMAPHRWKVAVAGFIGGGAALSGLVMLLAGLFRPRPEAMHGDARFATRGELAKQKMLISTPTGVVVGKIGKELIRLSGQQFIILAAPTRSGKGVGVVIPNLLDYQESMVVLDIKQENFDLTSGWRASQGQEVFLFNPFAEDGRTHRWNPLTYVSPNPAQRVSDLAAIASLLWPDDGGDDQFWSAQSRNMFMAFALYACERWDDDEDLGIPVSMRDVPTIGFLYRLSSGNGTGQDLRDFYTHLSKEPYLSATARDAFANLLSQSDKTFPSITAGFKQPLGPWLNPYVDAATSADDFLLTDVRKKRMTVYIGILPNKLAESRIIVNLFFSQLINVNTRELPQNNPALKHQCLLLMDEFTAIGKVEIITSAVAYMAGYNIRLLPIIQSLSQLDSVYGAEVSRTLVTNHALQIVYAPREQKDATDYSEMLGYRTVRRINLSKGRETTRNHAEERRALMLPQELKALGPDREIIFYEGIPHPIRCQKIRYYQDPYFTARLLPAVDVPQLQVKAR
jgi:Type IV secretory pathway, VirD4 components